MKILGIANNYKGMPDEEPTIFWKGDEAVLNHSDQIKVPAGYAVVWPEVELAVKRVFVADLGQKYIYGVAMDITAGRSGDVHLPRSKALRNFCPISEDWATDYDPNARIHLSVNGQELQNDYIRNMRFSPERSIEYVTRYFDFNIGDILITGTPPHPYYDLQDGDVVTAFIVGIGLVERKVSRK